AFGQYDEKPDETGGYLHEFASSGFVNIVGGCCGTTPDHIAAIAKGVEGLAPRGTTEPRGTPKGAPYDGGTPKGAPYDGGTPKGAPYDGGTPKGAPYDGGTPKGAPYDGTPKGVPYDEGTKWTPRDDAVGHRFSGAYTQFSGLETLTIRPDANFQMIGERTNVTGSQRFARLIRSENYAEAARVALDQVRGGANLIDV